METVISINTNNCKDIEENDRFESFLKKLLEYKRYIFIDFKQHSLREFEYYRKRGQLCNK